MGDLGEDVHKDNLGQGKQKSDWGEDRQKDNLGQCIGRWWRVASGEGGPLGGRG